MTEAMIGGSRHNNADNAARAYRVSLRARITAMAMFACSRSRTRENRTFVCLSTDVPPCTSVENKFCYAKLAAA